MADGSLEFKVKLKLDTSEVERDLSSLNVRLNKMFSNVGKNLAKTVGGATAKGEPAMSGAMRKMLGMLNNVPVVNKVVGYDERKDSFTGIFGGLLNELGEGSAEKFINAFSRGIEGFGKGGLLGAITGIKKELGLGGIRDIFEGVGGAFKESFGVLKSGGGFGKAFETLAKGLGRSGIGRVAGILGLLLGVVIGLAGAVISFLSKFDKFSGMFKAVLSLLDVLVNLIMKPILDLISLFMLPILMLMLAIMKPLIKWESKFATKMFKFETGGVGGIKLTGLLMILLGPILGLIAKWLIDRLSGVLSGVSLGDVGSEIASAIKDTWLGIVNFFVNALNEVYDFIESLKLPSFDWFTNTIMKFMSAVNLWLFNSLKKLGDVLKKIPGVGDVINSVVSSLARTLGIASETSKKISAARTVTSTEVGKPIAGFGALGGMGVSGLASLTGALPVVANVVPIGNFNVPPSAAGTTSNTFNLTIENLNVEGAEGISPDELPQKMLDTLANPMTQLYRMWGGNR